MAYGGAHSGRLSGSFYNITEMSDSYSNCQHLITYQQISSIAYICILEKVCELVAEWLRRLTRKPKVRTAVGSNLTLDSLVAVRNTSPGRPEPCEGNLVAVAGSCRGLMVKHP